MKEENTNWIWAGFILCCILIVGLVWIMNTMHSAFEYADCRRSCENVGLNFSYADSAFTGIGDCNCHKGDINNDTNYVKVCV